MSAFGRWKGRRWLGQARFVSVELALKDYDNIPWDERLGLFATASSSQNSVQGDAFDLVIMIDRWGYRCSRGLSLATLGEGDGEAGIPG